MRLERLEIAGFKSFSEPVTAEFPEQITVVVGPNGSGKSNIVDAVRWVLGEQSAAGLRCSRMDELIFSGSDNRRRLSLAEVRAEFLESEGQGLTIARRIDRSGRSDYRINGRRCRLRDIHDRFLGTGLGRKSYAVIGQGEVERIIDARGDEMRYYLEEVAGVSRYRMLMKETERALLQTEESLQRYADMMDLRLEYLGPLKEQAKRARLHRILAGREERLRRALVAQELRHAARKIEESRRQEADLEAEGVELNRREKGLGRQYSRSSEAMDEIRDWIRRLERGQRRLGEKRSEAGTRLAVVEERLKSLAETKGRARKALEDVRSRLTEHTVDADEDPPPADAEIRLARIVGDLEGLKGRVRETSLRLQRVEDVVTRSTEIEAELKLRGRDTEREMAAAERELGECFRQIARGAEELRELEADAGDGPSGSSDAEEMARELEAIDEQFATARAQLKSYRQQRDEQRRKRDVVGDRLARWEGRMQALHEMAGDETAAAVDLPAGAASLLSRIQVPAGWEGAVERALGPWLEAAIAEVGDVGGDSGDTLILADVMTRLTDRAGVDRASWKTWLLERGWGESAAGWLDEGIQFGDSSSERAIGHFCSRFLVVESRETLLELAGGIWSDVVREGAGGIPRGPLPCIVTPEGELADLAGALCVDAEGASSRREGAASPLEMHREIRRLRIGLRDCRSELAEAQGLAESSEKQWGEQLAWVRELEEKRRRLATSLERHRGEQKSSERRVQRMASLRKQRKDLTERVTQLERDKAHMERDLVRLSDARSHLFRHRKRWAAIGVKRRSEVHRLQSEVEKHRYEEIALRERLSGAKQRTEQRARERDHLDRQKKRWIETIEECREKIGISETDRAALDQRVRGFDGALQRTARRLDEAGERRVKASSELNEARRELSNLQRRRGQVEKALNGMKLVGVRAQTEFDSACRRAEEMGMQPGEVGLEGEEMSEAELARSRRRLSDLEGRRRDLEPVNPLALEDFRREKRQLEEMQQQRRDIVESLGAMRHLSGEIDAQVDDRYSATLRKTSATFNRTFADLFQGGHAEILTRGSDPREAEVEIRAQPPGKRLARLSLLSGGERALAGIAFLFALQKMRPSPMCVFDEIDAALDDANTVRFVRYLKRQKNDVQYLIVTHQKKTMEIADTLHGVTMSEPGVSELVSVRLEDAGVEGGQGGAG